MKKSEAKELLGYNIPELQNMSLDERFDKYRDLYCPNFFELNTQRNESAIKSIMFDKMFKKHKAGNPDVASNAFVRFSEVNEAYNTLSTDNEYDKFSLEFDKIEEYDNKRYGEKGGKFKRILAKIASFGYIFLILTAVWLVLSLMIKSYELVGIVAMLLLGFFGLAWLADFIYSPIDKLLVMPYTVIDYVVITWKKKRFILKKLILCYLMGCFGAIVGLFSFFVSTKSAYRTRIVRYHYNKKYKEFCKELINERYERTLKEIDDYLNSKGSDEYNNSVEAKNYWNNALAENMSHIIESGREMALTDGSFYSIKLSFSESELKASYTDKIMAGIQLKQDKESANQLRTSYMFAQEGDYVAEYNEADRFFDKVNARADYDEKVEAALEKNRKNTQELEIINARVDVAAVKYMYLNANNANI